MKKSEEEKNIFLSICCLHDRDMLTGKIEMKKEDFERITYLPILLWLWVSYHIHSFYTMNI